MDTAIQKKDRRKNSESRFLPARKLFGSSVVLLALCAGLYWAWWDSFHEMVRFFHLLNPSTYTTFLEGGVRHLHCIVKPSGIVLGSTMALALILRTNLLNGGKLRKTALAVMAVQVLLLVPFCLAFQCSFPFLAQSIYLFASALMSVPTIAIACTMKTFSARQCAAGIVGTLGCYACLNNLLYPLFFQSLPKLLVAVLYTVLLVAAWICARKLLASAPPQDERVTSPARPPWQLVVHLVVYGFIFGSMHILEGFALKGPYSVNLGVFFGCLVAMGLFAPLFLRKGTSQEIWSKMRSTVFPLATIGFIVLPISGSNSFAVALTEAGGLLYLAFLFYSCVSLMRRTSVDPRLIVCCALLFYSIGEVMGVTFTVWTKPDVQTDLSGYLFLAAIIVFMLTAATFWVGTDEQIRKIWGLRRNLAPKRYNDQLTKARVAAMERRFDLTSRESQVLLLIAQGKHAPEIQSAMGVSMSTVRSHIKHLYMKIDAHSYVEVVTLLEGIPIDEGELHAAE